jgi:hypothetical protein
MTSTGALPFSQAAAPSQGDATSQTAATSLGRGAFFALGGWLAAAAAAVGFGAFARAPAIALPRTVIGAAAIVLGTLLGRARGRRWADAVAPAHLAWFHAWRLVPGAAFLVLYARGALPWGFAVPGGIGDIAIALSTPAAAWAARRQTHAARTLFLAWSVLGFADLANVVAHAMLSTRADPSSMHLLRELPLGLLPTFAVPLTFAAHVLAFWRMRPGAARERAPHMQ